MSDVGLRLVDSLYEQLMIDDEWAVRRKRGFTWWAFRLAQHVEVSEPFWSIDRYVCSVRIWTEVVRDVDASTDPAILLAGVNAYTTLSAVVWDEEESTVNDCCTAQVHDEVFVWLSKVLATAAVLQNTAAHTRAHSLASAIGGVPAASNHPVSGERPEMDDLLNLPEQVIVREGAAPSRFIGAKFEGLDDCLREMGSFGSVDPDGLTCEIPFTGATPAAFIQEATELQTSLIQMFTDVPHPEAGSGLLCLMRLPYNASPEEIASEANRLNLLEAQGDTATALLGSWCPDPQSGTTLAFCAFIPNVLAQWILVQNVIVYTAKHSQFAAIQLIE